MSYADAWLKWFRVIEAGAAPLTARMLDLAALADARRVLDLGTGIGEPATSAAARLRDKGRVLAVDSDPQMIDLASARARALGIDNIDFEVADIASLAPPAGSLDAVLARWSLMFVDDLSAVVERMHAALRPGGRLVIATWAEPERVPALTLARRVARAQVGDPPPEYAQGSPFCLADRSRLGEILQTAGLVDIHGEFVTVTYTYATPEEYIENRLDLTGPLWDGMEDADAAIIDSVNAAIAERLQAFRAKDGSYRLANRAICMAATATCSRLPDSVE